MLNIWKILLINSTVCSVVDSDETQIKVGFVSKSKVVLMTAKSSATQKDKEQYKNLLDEQSPNSLTN